jgi:hypothetical protein
MRRSGAGHAALEAAIKIEEQNRVGQRMYSGDDDDAQGEMRRRTKLYWET